MTKKKEIKKTRVQIAKERAKAKAKAFEKELRNSIGAAIIAAFGFLMALTWRDIIVDIVNKISEEIPFGGKLISAFVVTIICVLGISLFTKFLVKKDAEK